MVFSNDNLKGFVLSLLSSGFIGSRNASEEQLFVIKKKGLRRAAVVSGVRDGIGGYTYLLEPLWWIGMITMIIGEVANFVAYSFAPAVLVTPLGALSIIASAVLAHIILNEKLHPLGILGCVMCIAGSVIIVIHAPQEKSISSAQEIWNMATQAGKNMPLIIRGGSGNFRVVPRFGNSMDLGAYKIISFFFATSGLITKFQIFFIRGKRGRRSLIDVPLLVISSFMKLM